MKLFVVEVDMLNVLGRLKRFDLREFNHPYPILFIEAKDPDDACYLTSCMISEILLKQDESVETALLIKEVLNDIRIKKVNCRNEKEL